MELELFLEAPLPQKFIPSLRKFWEITDIYRKCWIALGNLWKPQGFVGTFTKTFILLCHLIFLIFDQNFLESFRMIPFSFLAPEE